MRREVAVQARGRGLTVHFSLLVGAGYSGYVIWHMGYSGSGPLTAMTEGPFMREAAGRVIPVSETTFSTWSMPVFLPPGFVSFFVPSNGSQFAAQGRIMMKGAGQAGVAQSIAIMAVVYGKKWTNMIQPFWALPVLAIAGLKMCDILRFSTMTLLAAGAVFLATMQIVSL